MAKIRRLVPDVLKPHEPSIVDVASGLGDPPGVGSVSS